MEIEKNLTVTAPPAQVWALLLDPQIMAGAVPGMKSIEVISPTEYVAEMHQKISFINAKFKLRTHIVEQRAPEYLRAEGTGEDASVASSLKQTSEVFLTPTADGGTELRIKVNVDVLGRLGAFGLSVMKTKADRLWEEFGRNLVARIESGGMPAPSAEKLSAGTAGTAGTAIAQSAAINASALPCEPAPTAPQPSILSEGQSAASVSMAGPASSGAACQTAFAQSSEAPRSWWSRVFGVAHQTPVHSGTPLIRVEIRQMNKTIHAEWPVQAAAQCREWLQSLDKA